MFNLFYSWPKIKWGSICWCKMAFVVQTARRQPIRKVASTAVLISDGLAASECSLSSCCSSSRINNCFRECDLRCVRCWRIRMRKLTTLCRSRTVWTTVPAAAKRWWFAKNAAHFATTIASSRSKCALIVGDTEVCSSSQSFADSAWYALCDIDTVVFSKRE